MACDVSWKAKMPTLHDENLLLKHLESTVKERENIKLEFQRLFNSVKATRAQHQNKINEMIESVNQKTYVYANVRAQNQDLLMTISELKSKLRMIEKRKNVNTKFDTSKTLGKLLCVTPFNKNLANKSKNVSNTKVPSDRSKPVTSSGCSKHMTGNLQLLRNFVKKFTRTVRFGNDHFVAITGYGDYIQGNLTICHAYYVEGLGYNLFSVGQFYDGDLEVAFRSNTCYVQNLEGDGLLTGSRDSNLYTIFIFKMVASSPVCLMSRATSTKSWLWHCRLSHLNFGTINQLTSHDIVDRLLKFKYNKDHLCSTCEQGKSKKASLPPKLVPSTESKLELLYMDLCGPMRDEAPNMIVDFVNQVQRNLKAQILMIRTDNRTEFNNEKLRAFYAKLGIVHQTSIARTPQQNGVVERRNRTLIKAARTMLIFSKAPEFLWAKAIATVCFTQNRSIVHTRHNKTPYELIHSRKPNFQYFHVFGSLCYPTNDCDDLGKMKSKADIGIFVGYSESLCVFRIYNRRTKKIMEMIHVKFDELAAMSSECKNLEPKMNCANFNDSSEDSQSVPSTSDLDNLFGPMYEEYYATRSLKRMMLLKKSFCLESFGKFNGDLGLFAQPEFETFRLVDKCVAKPIEEYEKTRANLDNVGSFEGNSENVGGTVNVQGCSHKTFINGKPHPFNGTKGVVGLRRWIKKVEKVFEICKCVEEDKVMFAASTFEGRALTWSTEIQRMEHELWTLTLKGDDIKAYNNRFHELALMCLELEPNEKKKIESESNKRKWDDQQGNNHHQQRQEAAKDYVATPAKGSGYAGNLPWCNREMGHYRDKCPRGRNPQNEGARGRAYVMRTKEPQQDLNIITGTS
nr:retrovirus-related Pol polyprotein from transposon TNT 1-94 [Tanacetum cinerariifolium]